MTLEYPKFGLRSVTRKLRKLPKTDGNYYPIPEILPSLKYIALESNGAARAFLHAAKLFTLIDVDLKNTQGFKLTDNGLRILSLPIGKDTEFLHEIAFLPELFQVLRQRFTNDTSISRKRIHSECEKLGLTAYNLRTAPSSYWDTLQFIQAKTLKSAMRNSLHLPTPHISLFFPTNMSQDDLTNNLSKLIDDYFSPTIMP
jgi:hypothetical protein